MLVLLPPSETKSPGGRRRSLSLDSLSFSDLNPLRRKLIDAVVDLANDPLASARALGLSPRQEAEVTRNREIWSSPVLPAVERYTGVLYEALDIGSMTTAARSRVRHRTLIACGLFGVVRGTDQIPAYRLSAGNLLPCIGSLRAFWQSTLETVFAEHEELRDELIVDLRSEGYRALARIPGAVSVRVVTEDASGARTTVSHHNKAYKGRLARALLGEGRSPGTIEGIAAKASRAGFAIERSGKHELTLITAE